MLTTLRDKHFYLNHLPAVKQSCTIPVMAHKEELEFGACAYSQAPGG